MSGYPALALLALVSTMADAAQLPLKPGTYVLAGTACNDPPFAATFSYDGRAFSYPHATRCRSAVAAHNGKTYKIAETCSALGDGTPARAHTLTATYTVDSRTRVEIRKAGEKGRSLYRWCEK